ncbi:MAG: protein kinase, partial [Gammaproteobacteria bacterium]
MTPDHVPDYQWGLERFISEGRTLVRFDHPAIVRVLSVFEEHGTAYLVMRFERGQTLAAELKQKKTLPEERVRAVIDTCMDGLETVHPAGFIHRDIKPANIYLRDDGHALLIDFGSARQALS